MVAWSLCVKLLSNRLSSGCLVRCHILRGPTSMRGYLRLQTASVDISLDYYLSLKMEEICSS
jgi:hypothetical protein